MDRHTCHTRHARCAPLRAALAAGLLLHGLHLLLAAAAGAWLGGGLHARHAAHGAPAHGAVGGALAAAATAAAAAVLWRRARQRVIWARWA